MARFLFGWQNALCGQRLPAMEKLDASLVNHFDGIAAYGEHAVGVGTVGSEHYPRPGPLPGAGHEG